MMAMRTMAGAVSGQQERHQTNQSARHRQVRYKRIAGLATATKHSSKNYKLSFIKSNQNAPLHHHLQAPKTTPTKPIEFQLHIGKNIFIQFISLLIALNL